MTLPKGFDPPPPLPEKKLRCKMGLHSFENKVRGKLNTCKKCRRQYYVKTWKEDLKDSFKNRDGVFGDGGDGGGE